MSRADMSLADMGGAEMSRAGSRARMTGVGMTSAFDD